MYKTVNDFSLLPKDLEHEECLKIAVRMYIRITSHTDYKRDPTQVVLSLVGLIICFLNIEFSDVDGLQFTFCINSGLRDKDALAE